MMSNIFFSDNNVGDFKKFVSVSTTVSMSEIQSKLLEAGEQYIKPRIGQLYDEGLAAYRNSNATDAQQTLIEFIQRPLANFALHQYLPFLEVQVEESGLFRFEGQSQKNAYKYQKDNLREALMTTAYTSLEWLVLFVEDNLSTFSWYRDNNDSPRLRNNAHLINYSKDFTQYHKLRFGAWTFDAIKPIIGNVEDFIVEKAIGTNYLNALRTNLKNHAILNEDDRASLDTLRKAIVHFSLEWAIRIRLGRLTPNGFEIVRDGNEYKSLAVTANSNPLAVALALSQGNTIGNMYLSKLERLLSKPNAYTLYKDYIATEESEASTYDHTTAAIYKF